MGNTYPIRDISEDLCIYGSWDTGITVEGVACFVCGGSVNKEMLYLVYHLDKLKDGLRHAA